VAKPPVTALELPEEELLLLELSDDELSELLEPESEGVEATLEEPELDEDDEESDELEDESSSEQSASAVSVGVAAVEVEVADPDDGVQ